MNGGYEDVSYVLYGAGGVLLALALLLSGAVLGWKGHTAWVEHTRRAVVEEVTEEEKRRQEAEQKAFSDLLNYNEEMAYSGQRDFSGGGEDE